MNPNISASDLRRAADIKEKLEALESDLNKILGGEVQNGVPGSNAKPSRRGRRKMSAAAKAKIAAAARARWAKVKAAGKRRL
jgi:hypothetical protein